MLGIVYFLAALCWAVSGIPVGESDVSEYNVNTLLSKLPHGGYIISFDENHRPFVYANLTDGSSNNTTHIVVDPSTSATPSNAQLAQKHPRTSDQWGCIVGETVDETCYGLSADKLGQWCDAGHNVGRVILLGPFPPPRMNQVKQTAGGRTDTKVFIQVPKHSMLTWSVCQDVQVYICNYRYGQSCDGSELKDYMSSTIDSQCTSNGVFPSGWYLQGSGDKTYGRGIVDGKGGAAQVCGDW